MGSFPLMTMVDELVTMAAFEIPFLYSYGICWVAGHAVLNEFVVVKDTICFK